VFSNHRCHGHFLAYGGDLRALFAELMGKATGVCGGRGGSQHLHWKDFYSNGVQGGIVPVATGMALAEKRKKTGAIAVCFLGDGTLGQGVVYESLNMASLWKIPILYVLENNHIAQTTPTGLALAGTAIERFQAFEISTIELDTADVMEIIPVAADLLDDVRSGRKPRALVLHTSRFGAHSKGDDTRELKVVAKLKESRDPLKIHALRLTPEVRDSIENEVDARVAEAYQQALDDPLPELIDVHRQASIADPLQGSSHKNKAFNLPLSTKNKKSIVLQSLNNALHHVMSGEELVVILGEDILDPYGGAFKVSNGLSTRFPDRVIPTPISEAGIVGVATGMAMRGLRPVVEIMFGDFITLIADQVINHAAKFRWMYNDQVCVPLVIRTPMGGRRGYGPTHSQTIEKIFLGVPGLKVLAPCALQIQQKTGRQKTKTANQRSLDAGQLLLDAIADDDPVLFVENKLLYLQPIQDNTSLPEFDLTLASVQSGSPTYKLTIKGAPEPRLTIAAYGYMAELARQAAIDLAFEHEIFVELIVPTQLAPMDDAAITESTRKTGRLVVVEEGTLSLGWGTEVVARVAETLGSRLKAARRVAAWEVPVPSSGVLEELVLPGVDDIILAAQKMV
jgi:2-oxoisovalerate dehydrogenase E1 component